MTEDRKNWVKDELILVSVHVLRLVGRSRRLWSMARLTVASRVIARMSLIN